MSLFNGAGQNKLDGDTNKDIAARVQVYPLEGIGVKGFMVGGALYMTLRTEQARPNARDRFEADVRLDYDPILVQAEYLRARDYDATGNRTSSQGFYLAVAGNITPNWQLAGRFGGYDQDVDGTTVSNTWLWEAAGGVHFLPLGKYPNGANLKLDYVMLKPKVETASTRIEHQVILAAQLKF